jgi:hypothetical protein
VRFILHMWALPESAAFAARRVNQARRGREALVDQVATARAAS